MTESEFEELLNRPESTTLDFKKEQYKIINDQTGVKTSEFIKDIICFCNSIRTECAYIIIGVSTNENNEKCLLGLDNNIDDATFQEKIKDKVTPRPVFYYYVIRYKGKNFGLIEIPVFKYSEPVTPVVKMKGLEVGRVYSRRGSSNSEAIGREILLIDKWLNGLPSLSDSLNQSEEVSTLLSKITSNQLMLSNAISEALRIAKKYSLKKLLDFCNGELLGWHDTGDKALQKFYNIAYIQQLYLHFKLKLIHSMPLIREKFIMNSRKWIIFTKKYYIC